MGFSDGERPKAPTATTLWCCPCLENVCPWCKRCYNCCHCCKNGPPCPLCYYCLPCCCCCCRPGPKGVDEEETVVPTADQDLAYEEEEEQREATEGVEDEAEEQTEPVGAPEGEEVEAPKPKAAPKAKAKVKPRKQARPGKQAAKSSPAFFTGKAAGLPPPPKEACTGPPPEVGEPTVPVGLGAYLVYTDAEGGKLKTQWSKTPLTGAGILAYVRPEKEVGEYKFEKKSGTEVHAVNCQTCMASEFPADRVSFYEGWATFIKQLSAWGGSFVLLPAADVQPPPKVKIIMFNKGKLTPVPVGQEITPASFESLAVLPSNATKFDVGEMPQSDFLALASSQGALVSLKK